MAQSIPLSLYIHLPWCVRKCPYCDFNSYALNQDLPEKEYCERLLEDLKQDLGQYSGAISNRSIQSIFFGGGTPSLFKASSINFLLDKIERLCKFTQEIEITLEANPGTLDNQKMNDFKAAGINRLSLGAQSFQSDQLKTLGRIHTETEILQALEKIRIVGFKSFNIDIMYGLPNQSVAEGLADLKQALQFHPPHLSWYHLTLEPNTEFYKYPPANLPADDTTWTLFKEGSALLQASGLEQYEISAFSTLKSQCIHNLNYWTFGDYLGIGAGAHGKLTFAPTHHSNFPLDFKILRYAKTRYPKDYLKSSLHSLANSYAVLDGDRGFEFMLNVLRLEQGFSQAFFESRTGLKMDTIANNIQLAKDKGLLFEYQNHFMKTALGKQFLNDLLLLFLPNKS